MMYGVIFISALAAMIVGIVVVDKHPPAQVGAPGEWSQDATDNDKTAITHSAR
jgi:hypothetical protein